MTKKMPKGYEMEEVLRRYFIRAGYFTVRGVPFVYEGFDITDVDIWLYDRPSSVSRQRIIVDVKNKKTPQVIERIFWTKGLREVLGVEQAIVATTDRRAAVSDFGKEQDVLLLDGAFLDRLRKTSEVPEKRLSEEQFVALLGTYSPTKAGGDWKGRYKGAKRPLARDLGFNAINAWLMNAKYFAEQAQLVVTHKEVALRVLYMFISFIAVAFDFVMKDLAFVEPTAKPAALNDGLRHGSQGPAGTKRVLELATGLIDQYAPEQRHLAIRIKEGLNRELESIPTNVLAEYFAKQSVSQELFSVAKELEAAAYSSASVPPNTLSPSAKGIIGVLLDFWDMDRKAILQNGDSQKKKSGDPVVDARSLGCDAVQDSLPGIEGKDKRG